MQTVLVNIWLILYRMKKVKSIMSIFAFIAALIIGFVALFLPPIGIIDQSVLWFTAQLLVFTSGILGI